MECCSILLDSFSAVVVVASFYRREYTKSRSNSLLLQILFFFHSFEYSFYRFMELVVCRSGAKNHCIRLRVFALYFHLIFPHFVFLSVLLGFCVRYALYAYIISIAA